MTQDLSPTIRLNATDNVVVARTALAAGTGVAAEGITVAAEIPAGHKVATTAFDTGDAVRKYGQIIGLASDDIAPGDHVHVHNLAMADFDRDYRFCEGVEPVDMVPEAERATFDGIVRADGRVATRNYIGVIPTVGCSAASARFVADHFRGGALKEFPNVDGVLALTHTLGCSSAGGSEGFHALRRVLDGYARHPNFAGVVVLGLGCEVMQTANLVDAGLESGPHLHIMNIQECGGTAATMAAAIAAVEAMLPAANDVARQPVPASHLVLGLECGGSDAYSGISANPALGAAADLVVRHGGTAVLAETTEIYGAEHLLTRRAVTREVGEKLIGRVRWWEDYTARNHSEMNNNPSPGNKAGGLTTILEKSLGATAKGGTTNLVDVYLYAEPVTAKGFVFMDTPGNDPVSITGMVAGGANVVCFTTGRGSMFGGKPVPSLKLATNTPMYRRLSSDMDINCGPIVDEGVSIGEIGRRIFETVLATASGRHSKSEALGIGETDFAPWLIGAVM